MGGERSVLLLPNWPPTCNPHGVALTAEQRSWVATEGHRPRRRWRHRALQRVSQSARVQSARGAETLRPRPTLPGRSVAKSRDPGANTQHVAPRSRLCNRPHLAMRAILAGKRVRSARSNLPPCGEGVRRRRADGGVGAEHPKLLSRYPHPRSLPARGRGALSFKHAR